MSVVTPKAALPATPLPAAESPPSSVAHRNLGLDFLRGIAILLVLCSHYTFPSSGVPPLDWISAGLKSIGGIGVNLFFALSGFLVGGLLLQEYKRTGTVNARRFLVRRAFKIWPALYVLVVFHALLGRHRLEDFFWQNLFHVQNYFGTSIAQTWSLAVEEHFYVFLTVLLVAMVGRTPRVIGIVLLAVCAASTFARLGVVAAGNLDAAFRQTQYRMDGLMWGVLLALLYTFYPDKFAALAKRRALLWAATSAAFLTALLTVDSPFLDRGLGYTVQALGFCAALVLLHTMDAQLSSRRAARLIAWIGLYSYGIYLWHTIAQEPGRRIAAALQAHGIPDLLVWLATVGAQFAGGIAVGFFMTKAVEWPFLRLRERLVPATSSSTSAVRSTPCA